MKTERSFVHAMGPARCRIGEGLLPERSFDVKEAQGMKKTHTWQLRTMTDKGRLLTDSTNLGTHSS